MARYYTYYYRTGSNSPDSGGDWRYFFDVYYNQSVSGNYSNVTIEHYIQFANQPSNARNRKWCTGNSIDGGAFSLYTDTFDTPSGNATRLIATQTRKITHNADGTKSFYLECRGGFSEVISGSSIPVYTYKYSDYVKITLPTINRASSITSNATKTANKQFGDSITFTMSRYNSKFTHKLTYKSGGTTYTIGEDLGTSKSYTFPTDLVSNYPNSSKPTITVTCTTYNGTKKIGSSNTTVYLTVPNTYVPSVSLAITEANELVPSAWGVFVEGKSKLNVIVNADLTNDGGASVKSYYTKINNQVYSTSEFTTSELNASGENIIETTITDSRGRTATCTQTISVIPYTPPTINSFKVLRCNADGTLNEEGTYGKAIIDYEISEINGLNAKTLRINLGETIQEISLDTFSGECIAATLFEGLQTNESYTFNAELIDTFDIVPSYFELSPSFVTRSLLNGGKGITLGRTATEEGFNSYMKNNFYDDTYMINQNVNGLKTIKNGNVYIRYVEVIDE